MDSANCPECHTQFSRKDNMTRHYKYKHGNEHQPSPPHKMLPPPPAHKMLHPPPQKGEGLTPLPPAQESEWIRSFEPSQETVTLQHPFTLQAIGCTGSGKTCWMNSLLERARIMSKPSPGRIIWCYKRWQPLFSEMQRNINNIIFIQGIPENLNEDTFIDTTYPSLIVIDDRNARRYKQ